MLICNDLTRILMDAFIIEIALNDLKCRSRRGGMDISTVSESFYGGIVEECRDTAGFMNGKE